MNHFTRTVTRNSAFGMGAQLAIKLLSFGFSILVVRQLGAEAFGQYASVLAFGAIFAIISDLGLSPYAVREVARHRDGADRDRVAKLYGNILALRLVLSLVAILLVTAAALYTNRPTLMVIGIVLNAHGLLVYSALGASESVLMGYERLDISSMSKVLIQLTFVVLGAVVLWTGLGYLGLIVANLVGVALASIVCWRGLARLGIWPLRPNALQWSALLRASLPFGVIGFALGLSYKLDSVLLNIYRGDAEVGYYNAAYNLVFSAAILSNVINTALYPSLARQAASAPQLLPSIHERILRYLLLLALPIAVGGWALADQIIPLLFRESFVPAVPALEIVIWVVPLMFVSEFLGYVVVVSGKERRVAQAIVISTAINVTLNLFLVPRFGYIAAAVMTVVTEIVLVCQYVWTLRITLRRFDWSTTLLRPAVAAVLMGGVALALQSYNIPLLLNIPLSAAVYLGAAVVFGALGRDELQFFRFIRRGSESLP